ncbi:helix-turn-helix transcriptional regulator [Streptomyces sp. B1866]|uniref:helix-turn-helix domain-containing protein n=1 Tax=Streptomyces sp. B1866 TaxID=3075431 RepID=UPI0028900FA5|nr:helix-turn-helix transcriptional regulator [Streptomyces sp. B1866]MDT3397932.1 helix-turn-helix transcriptional regulator [Streptomyces sp. B1866]
MANGPKKAYLGSIQAAWLFFGSELKRRREAAGLTQAELGMRIFCSGGYVGQFEQAVRKPQLELARRIDDALQTDGFFGRMCEELVNASSYADYFAAAAELEALAIRISEYAPTIVPGLLQTAEYARAITLAYHPFAPEEYVVEKVDTRLERARILERPDPPEFWAVIHETVLRIPVGSRATMAEQLDRMAAMAKRRRVLLQVLPFSAGAHAMMAGMLYLMEFSDAPDTAYSEGLYNGRLLDDPALVKRCRTAYDLVRATALSREESLAMIESAAEGYKKCSSRS